MKRKRSAFSILLTLLLFSAISPAGIFSKPAFRKGEAVFAQWVPNFWHRGVIADTCPIGWLVNFNNGKEKCSSLFNIVKDRVPAPGELKVGTAVLARWTNSRYYPGTIAGIAEGRYYIQFDDGDQGRVPINFIRKR